jgi:hypothetical protein
MLTFLSHQTLVLKLPISWKKPEKDLEAEEKENYFKTSGSKKASISIHWHSFFKKAYALFEKMWSM